MVQVCAISNDTSITPERSAFERTNDDFPALLEKEKQKVLLPYLPLNFQSIISVPSDFNFKIDNTISRINTESRAEDHPRNAAVNNTNIPAEKRTEPPKNTGSMSEPVCASTTAKVSQVQYSSNMIPKIFVGELELNSEFYGVLSSINNDKGLGLQKIDLSDLISQIKEKIRVMKENSKVELSIRLNPEDLGSILMNISSNKGIISIAIYANTIAKQSLDESLKDLESALKKANLNVGSLNVYADGHKRNNNCEYLAELLYNNGKES